MASHALTSLLESTLHFVKSSYSIDIKTVVKLLEDRAKLSLQLLKYLARSCNTNETLKLVEEKLRIAACVAEYSLEGCKQNDRPSLKTLILKADNIDLLNKHLLKTLMPEFISHQEQLPFVVSLAPFDVHRGYGKFTSYHIRSKFSKVEKSEIVDFLVSVCQFSSESRSVRNGSSVVACNYSTMENWFWFHDLVAGPVEGEDTDYFFYLEEMLWSVLTTNQVYSETYLLDLNGRSFEELCECLRQHLEDESYSIVMHHYGGEAYSFPISLNDRISGANVEDTFCRLVFGERSCPVELEIIVENICRSCKGESYMLFMVVEYLSKIDQTIDNWLIVQESLLNNENVFHDKKYLVISALIKASEDIYSVQAEEMSISFEKHEIKRFEHIKASSEEGKAKDIEKVELRECLDQLIPEILQSSGRLEKVAIVGMAGIGKTTLAKQIFDHASVSSHFHIRAWIGISQLYQKGNLLIQLLLCITHLTDFEILNMTDGELEEKVYKCLKGQRYCIVMDDMWSEKAWSELKRTLPDDNLGSCILLTSRETNLIENLNCKIVHRMSLLSENKSWELLRKKVFGHDICPRDLVVIGKHIAARCEGLPLAIVVVAGILLKIIKTADSWEVVAESVSSHVMGSESATRAIFALSYEHLPDYLKSCFLYMAAFPGGYGIEVPILIRSWIAEGFIGNDPLKCLEDVAEECLHDLIDRSLLLSGSTRSNGRLKTCRIHDLVLEFCVQEARERKFSDVIKDFRQLNSKSSDGHQRFSFHCHTFDDVHLTASKSLAGTALFFGISFDLMPDILLHYLDFKLLRILDVISWHFDNFPTEHIAKLLLLRYLALTASFELPDTVFNLQKLQTLIINGPWLNTSKIPELPLQFWRSTSLRHVELGAVNHLSFPEKSTEAESLNLLQTLTKITLASCTHECFSSIPNVLTLGVCETHEDFSIVGLWESFFKNLVLLKCIQTLKISCFGHNRPLPLPSLDAFPNSLKQLTLRQSNLPWDAMALIGDLPNLEVLKLRKNAFQGPKWETREGGFRCLKYLMIEETNLTCWELENHHFPRLEQLVLKFCKALEEIPAEIGDISTLTHIKLENCCYSVEKSAKVIQEQCKDFEQDIKIQIRPQKTFSNASPEEN